MIDPGYDHHRAGVLDYRVAPGPALSLLLDAPHSGTEVPADFVPAVPKQAWQAISDPFVDALIEGTGVQGASVLKVLFPRSYIDLNRGLHDLSAEVIVGDWLFWPPGTRGQQRGAGLIRRFVDWQTPMYRQPLPSASALRRVTDFYQPYHDLLAAALERLRQTFGAAYHVNCHSMKSVGGRMNKDAGMKRADFVLSDRDGGSSDPQFTAWIAAALRQRGYHVAVNDPFKGAEILRRHGAPDNNIHSVQIEINRRLYIDEASGEKHSGFESLELDLQAVVADFAAGPGRLMPPARRGPAIHQFNPPA
jgi:N-formylglutamate deformylase